MPCRVEEQHRLQLSSFLLRSWVASQCWIMGWEQHSGAKKDVWGVCMCLGKVLRWRSHLALPCSLLGPHPCPQGFSVWQETLKPPRKKQELLQPCVQAWSLGHIQQGGPDKGPLSIPSLLHLPLCLFPQRPQRSQTYSILSGGVHTPPGVSSCHL